MEIDLGFMKQIRVMPRVMQMQCLYRVCHAIHAVTGLNTTLLLHENGEYVSISTRTPGVDKNDVLKVLRFLVEEYEKEIEHESSDRRM